MRGSGKLHALWSGIVVECARTAPLRLPITSRCFVVSTASTGWVCSRLGSAGVRFKSYAWCFWFVRSESSLISRRRAHDWSDLRDTPKRVRARRNSALRRDAPLRRKRWLTSLLGWL